MTTRQRLKVSGKELMNKVKELIRQGNIIKIRLIHEGRPPMNVPFAAGPHVTEADILSPPVLREIGALAASVTECTVEFEKAEPSEKQEKNVMKLDDEDTSEFDTIDWLSTMR